MEVARPDPGGADSDPRHGICVWFRNSGISRTSAQITAATATGGPANTDAIGADPPRQIS